MENDFLDTKNMYALKFKILKILKNKLSYNSNFNRAKICIPLTI